MTQPLHYRITPTHPEAHVFTVECTVPDPDPHGQVVSMAAWVPGSYMIRDFARNVVRLWAQAGDQALGVDKLDKQTWRCAACDGPVTLVYEIYAWELSVRAAHLDTTHGYFNGTSVFLRVHGREDRPAIVEIRPPAGAAYQGWRVATAMPRAAAAPLGFGTYRAADYEELVDHPVEMGTFTQGTFEVAGVPHEIVITGRHRADMDHLIRDLHAVCAQHAALFGELPVQERYVFLITTVGEGHGGLEHRASCSLLCPRDGLPRPGIETVTDEYRELLALCSHEYFHTWNVKRIKPAQFVPYDLSREVHTRLLWAFEGITSYYESLALVRAGCISPESYLELLGRDISRLLRGTGRYKQSLVDSSFDAWTKFYKQDENAPNAIVSYYTKGAVVALALDLTLRQQTDGQCSLDDVMRALWTEYGSGARGVPEQAVEELAAAESGLDLTGFFDMALRGTADLDLEPLLAAMGIVWHLRPAESAQDKGGTPPKNAPATPVTPALGVRTADEPQGARLIQVLDGGAAQRAGLAPSDVVVALDGLRVGPETLEARLARLPAGESVPVHVFRRDELMVFEVVPGNPALDTCYLALAEAPEAVRDARREAWLRGSDDASPD